MVMHLLEVLSFPSCLLYMVFSRIKGCFLRVIAEDNVIIIISNMMVMMISGKFRYGGFSYYSYIAYPLYVIDVLDVKRDDDE